MLPIYDIGKQQQSGQSSVATTQQKTQVAQGKLTYFGDADLVAEDVGPLPRGSVDESLNVLEYPSGLGQNQDISPSFVQFQIISREGSKYVTNESELREYTAKREDSGNLNLDKISAATQAGADFARGVANATASFLDNARLNAILPTTGGLDEEEGAVGSTNVVSAFARAAGTAFVDPAIKKFILKDVINLYLSAPPAVKYNMNYNNAEFGPLIGLVEALANVSGSGISAGLQASALRALNIPSALGLPPVGTLLGGIAGVSVNPFKEVIFESVNFREFSFTYKFMPQSLPEMEEVNSIIKTFKRHMHPELFGEKFFFRFPSEFLIKYRFGSASDEQTFYHEFKPCFLEDVEIIYGSEQVSTFYDGMPTEINMKLSFRENEILTSESIEKGY